MPARRWPTPPTARASTSRSTAATAPAAPARASASPDATDGGSYIEDALTDEEAEEGYCLTCQMKPETDLVLRIAASSEVCKTYATDFNAEVLGVEQLSDSTISLKLKVENAEKLSFLPGQYVKIQVPGQQDTRSYSFSSPPGSDVATFLIRNVPGGLMSGYLTERAKPGDKLTLKGPLGS